MAIGTKDDIAAHAQKLTDNLIAEGKILPDSAAARAAAAVPSFSSGTLAQDPATGKVIVPDSVPAPSLGSEERIDPNATGALGPPATDAEAGAAAEAAAAGGKAGQQAAADTRERDPKSGQFKPAPGKQPEAPRPEPVRTQATGAEAAEQAAAEVLDAWQDAVELEYEGDGGQKYKVRAPKDQADHVRRGFLRRSTFDRNNTFMGRARPVLEPLIASGQIEPILPILQRALQDPDFGTFVTEAYNRRMTGMPLAPQQQQQAAPQAQPAQQQQVPGSYELPADVDPFFGEALKPMLAPMQQQLQDTQAQLARMAQERQQMEQRQAAQQQQYNQNAAAVQSAHQDLATRYPGEWTGDLARDQRSFDAAVAYGRDSGFVQAYGLRAGIVMAAEALRQERADTGSPAAELLNTLDRSQLAAAQAQAGAARSVAGGSPATAPPPARRPPAAPNPMRANGTRKSAQEFMAEAQVYAQQVAAAG